MRHSWLLLVPALFAGCASPMPTDISCQPYGYSPAPITFSFAPGPVTASVAEQTAVALFESCSASDAATTITDLTSTVGAAAGAPGPNAGQDVWLVKVDATVADSFSGATYPSHFLIEVNQGTGIPTIVGYG